MAPQGSKSIPIADLNPGCQKDERNIVGIVTLIWPYSSVQRIFSLLLVEPDFRLRSHRGQVRIFFEGPSAKALSRAGVDSGDQLSLRLEGVTIDKDDTTASTPGKGIEWRLRYGQFLHLQIQKESGQIVAVSVDNPPASPKAIEDDLSYSDEHVYNSHIPVSVRKPAIRQLDSPTSWSSPALLKRNHIASSTRDLFGDEAELDFPDNERRKRFKFGNGGSQWRFADRTPSPVREEGTSTMEIDTPSKPQDQPVFTDTTHAENETAQMLSDNVPDPVVEGTVMEQTHLVSTDIMHAEDIPEKAATVGNVLVNEDNAGLPSSTNAHTLQPVLEQRSPSDRNVTHYIEQEAQSTEETGRREPSPKINEPSTISVSSSAPTSPSSSSEETDVEEMSDSGGLSLKVIVEDAREGTRDKSPEVSSPTKSSPIPIETRERQHVSEESPSNTAQDLPQRDEDVIKTTKSVETPSPQQEAVPQLVDESKESPSVNEGAMLENVNEVNMSLEPAATADGDVSNEQRMTSEEPLYPILPTESVPDDAENDVTVRQLDNAAENLLDEGRGSNDIRSAAVRRINSDDVRETAIGVVQEQAPNDSQIVGPILTSTNVEVIDLESEVGEDDFAAFDEVRPAISPRKDSVPATNPEPVSIELISQSGVQHSAGSTEALRSQTKDPSLEAEIDTNRITPSRPGVNDFKARSEFITAQQFIREQLAAQEQEIDAASEEENPVPKVEALKSHDTGKITRDNIQNLESADVIVRDSLPSTIPDSLPLQSSEQLPTPSTTQNVSFKSHLSNISLETLPDTEILPSPRLTQDEAKPRLAVKSTDHELQARPIEQKSAAVPQSAPDDDVQQVDKFATEAEESEDDFEAVEKPMQAKASPRPNTIAKVTEPNRQQTDTKDVIIDSPAPPAREKVNNTLLESFARQTTTAQAEDKAEKTSISPPTFSPITPAKHRSILLDKLRASRRASNSSSLKSAYSSPWFAPRRSSQVVPDSDAESLPSETDDKKVTEEAADVTPKGPPGAFTTPTKRLSQTFVRSSPIASEVVSPASTMYTPHSQPSGGLRTKQGYFVALRSLSAHFGTLTDVLALAVSSTQITRTESGRRDWTLSCYLADGSMLQSGSGSHPLVTAQIFRPNRTSLPHVEPNDSIILRDFKVQFFAKRISLISTDTSAWAVFHNKTGEPQIKGPPLEIGPEERAYARKTREWWFHLSSEQQKRFADAVPSPPSTPPTTSKTALNGRGASSTGNVKGIKGIGIELPRSQSTSRDAPVTVKKKGNLYSTQALAKEWATGLIRSSEPEASSGDERPNITRRALRPRDTRGKTKSVSPEKEDPPARRGRGGARRGTSRGKSIEIGDSESEKEGPSKARGRRGKSVEMMKQDGSDVEIEIKPRGIRGGRRGQQRKF